MVHWKVLMLMLMVLMLMLLLLGMNEFFERLTEASLQRRSINQLFIRTRAINVGCCSAANPV